MAVIFTPFQSQEMVDAVDSVCAKVQKMVMDMDPRPSPAVVITALLSVAWAEASIANPPEGWIQNLFKNIEIATIEAKKAMRN